MKLKFKKLFSSWQEIYPPWPDGSSVLFFQEFWETMKIDVMDLLFELHNDNLKLKIKFKLCLCCVDPKSGGGSFFFSKFMPISLLNIVSKIVTKVLTTVLNAKLDELIDPFQSGFIKSRFILDVLLLHKELISNCFGDNLKGDMLLKLDCAKAYDMLNWDFLFEVMSARKSGDKWMNWMNICLQPGKSHILINGNPRRIICLKGGLRQGDPLSSLLFVLAVDSFTKNVKYDSQK